MSSYISARRHSKAVSAAALVVVLGCGQSDADGSGSRSLDSDTDTAPAEPDSGASGSQPGGQAGAASGSSGSSGSRPDGSVPDGPVVPPCDPGRMDADGDGFSVAQGDCQDCDPLVNPGAYDAPGNSLDDDCSGRVDDETVSCDVGLPVEADDPLSAAKALNLCRAQIGSSWGVLSAKWVYPDGSTGAIASEGCPSGAAPHPLSRALLGVFGKHIKPPQGKAMLALSSGIARPGVTTVPDPGYGEAPDGAMMCRASMAPPGFPKDPPSCSGASAGTGGKIWDAIALELRIKVPTNANGLRYKFNFYSSEFPNYVCSTRNDHFVALLTSKNPATPADKNISFDALGNVVSVNSGFMNVCKPITIHGRSFQCPKGTLELEGTGLDVEKQGDDGFYLQGGATSWLSTSAGVSPGEIITLRFAIWDADGGFMDSTVLIDDFSWLVPERPAAMEEPPETLVVL